MTPTAPTERGKASKPVLLTLSLVSLALYTLALPNPLFPKGLGPLAWIALAPLFAALPAWKPLRAAGVGAAYGTALYALSNSWLWTYHPAALIIACAYAAFGLAILFPLASRTLRSLPRAGFCALPFLWVSYEFLRARGFMAYPYGILGYAFWRDPSILGLASAGGVWLVSLVALSVNAALGAALARLLREGRTGNRRGKAAMLAAAAAGMILAASGAGSLLRTRWEPRGSLRAALIQPDRRERQRSVADYNDMADRVIRLTETARAAQPDLIVWHETAIVPPLGWHLRFRPNRQTLDLAVRVDGYIRGLDVPLLFGNGRAEPAGASVYERKNWNSAFLFSGGRELAHYDKMRLVPYSETFPPAKLLPGIAAAIEAEAGQFWEAGAGITVFRLGDARFCVPICFEDSFGEHTRAMAAAGADFLVVLTDDSWGKSVPCQYYHLSQSALRAAELGIPIARAANTGSTVLVGPDGLVVSELPPFTEGILETDIPLPPASYKGTPYRRAGDVFGWGSLIVGAAWVAAAVGLALAEGRHRCPGNPRTGDKPGSRGST